MRVKAKFHFAIQLANETYTKHIHMVRELVCDMLATC